MLPLCVSPGYVLLLCLKCLFNENFGLLTLETASHNLYLYFLAFFWIGTWILHLSCNTIVPIEISVKALVELCCIYWFTQLCPILNCNPDPGTRHKWPLNEWMIPWLSLNASFQRMLCGRPFTCLSRSTLHLDPLILTPVGWPMDQPQPPASLASPSIWQLGWVCTVIGLYVIGLAVFLLNTFSMQFPSLGSTNSPPLPAPSCSGFGRAPWCYQPQLLHYSLLVS